MKFLETFKSKKCAIAGIIILAIVIFTAVTVNSVYSYATEEYWAVKIGDKTIAVVNTENSAKLVIEKVKAYYINEDADVKSITIDPAMSIQEETYSSSDKPELWTVDEAVEYITTGTKEPVVYTVKSGDSLWSIAEENGFTVEEVKAMNEDIDISSIFPGDELNLYEIKPFVTVKIVQTVTRKKKIPYRTVYQTSSSVLKNMTVITQSGSKGTKVVTENLITENGEIKNSEVISSRVTKKSKSKIVTKGTGSKSAPPNGSTYAGNGSIISQYALKWVGNPYVYGGESLTGGADCSGFVKAVYAHYGISMAHDAGAMRNYGKDISLSAAQPGDLICYYGHIGIYIGGGQIVHAVNEGMGIAITGTGYIGPVISVRRIVE